MIVGIGTDICDVRRIEATLKRQGERFVRKVLTDAEVAVWQQRTARSAERGVRYLATRFSAKEAFSKAVGLGMRLPMTWRRCEIANQPSGQPVLVLYGELKTWFEAQGLIAHVSVTDENDYAASFVVVERPGLGMATLAMPGATATPATGAPAWQQQAPVMPEGVVPVPDPAPSSPSPSPQVPAVPDVVPVPAPAALSAPAPEPAAAAGPASPGDRSILGRFGSQI